MDYNNHIFQLKNFWLNILNNNDLIKNNGGSLSVFIGDEPETPFFNIRGICVLGSQQIC